MSIEIQATPAFRRVLLKISGEALIGEQSFGIDVKVAHAVAEEIKQLHALGVEVAVVVGGGQIFCGVLQSAGDMDCAPAVFIGVLAALLNAGVGQGAFEKLSVKTRVPVAI